MLTLPDHLAREQTEFLADIRSRPDEDTPRLVYADWLTERGEELGEVECLECKGKGRAESFRRTVCTECGQEVVGKEHYAQGILRVGYSCPEHGWRSPSGIKDVRHTPCGRCHGTGTVSNGLAARAEFIRHAMRTRDRSLWTLGAPWKTGDRTNGPGRGIVIDGSDRGFIEQCRCSFADWLAHHAAILAHPDVVLRRVELTTWPDADWQIEHIPDFLDPPNTAREGLLVALNEQFPGHCRHDDDQGNERHHPIQWVLPGELEGG